MPFSDPLQVECCAPHGSILGLLLFSIYVNDRLEAPCHCCTECYVDDAKLFLFFQFTRLPKDRPRNNWTSPADAQLVLRRIQTRQNYCFREPTDDLEAPWISFVSVGKRHFSSKISEISRRNFGSELNICNHITTTECIARLAQIIRVKDCLHKKYVVNHNTCLSFQQNVVLLECLGK